MVSEIIQFVRDRIRSFKYAFAGLRLLLREEHNAKIHTGIAIAVVTAGILLHVSPTEWALLSICIGTVMAAEAFNSSIERIADYLTIERDDRIRDIKDMSAGAVVLLATSAAVTGLLIFMPKIVYCIGNT